MFNEKPHQKKKNKKEINKQMRRDAKKPS